MRVAFHRSCHSRGTTYADGALALLRSIDGIEVVEVGEGEQCCGFGGTFSVAFPNVSRAMGTLKLDHVLAAPGWPSGRGGRCARCTSRRCCATRSARPQRSRRRRERRAR
jgi:Fe-S oxidoreductase